MELLDIKSYNSPNIYSTKDSIVKMVIKLGKYAEIPTKDINGFNEKLISLFPGLLKHHCALGYEGGFAERLKEGTYLPHVIEHSCLELQNMLGFDMKFGKARQVQNDIYNVIFSCRNKSIGKACGIFSYELIMDIINLVEINFEEKFRMIKQICNKLTMGPSTAAIFEAAQKRGIPVSEIDNGGILRLGYGKYQRFLSATLYERTSCISVDIACDKHLTKYILKEEGIPVPEGYTCSNEKEALKYGNSIGYPLVVKPKHGNHGKNVIMNINNENELIEASRKILSIEKEFVVEKMISGRDYRVLIVDGKFVAAAERIPAHIIGDGISTVEQLINVVNSDSKRGEAHEKPLTRIKIDEAAIKCIKSQGFELTSVPNAEQVVWIRETANLSTGGTAIDVSEKINSKTCEICEFAVKTLGLDIAGVDLKIPDITNPIAENYGAIIEINASPGIRMHLYPSEGKSKDVASPIIDMIYPKGELHSIPIVAVTGTNGKTTTTRMIGFILQNSGLIVGKTTTSGIFINDDCIEEGDTTGYHSASRILNNRKVEAAVLEVARGGIIKNGLAYKKSDVAVFTNLTSDHLGMNDINEIEDLFHVKSLVLECVKETGTCVINADDPWAKRAIEASKGKIFLFSMQNNNKLFWDHIKSGGKGIYTHENGVFLIDGILTRIIGIDEIAITCNGKIIHNVYNALAATAASYSLGVPLKTISNCLKIFGSEISHNKGRFNFFDMGNYSIVLDYGHNEDGYRNMINSLKKFSFKRLVGIIGVPGDRRDEDIIKIGEMAGESFDKIIIREDYDLRGRQPMETANLLLKGAISGGATSQIVEIIRCEKEALKASIDNSRDGDLIVVFFENYQPLSDIIENEKNKDVSEVAEPLYLQY